MQFCFTFPHNTSKSLPISDDKKMYVQKLFQRFDYQFNSEISPLAIIGTNL
jgi:hypothetical protein